MAKRSITDEEIALIKAMQARGMKNKDIQFLFNRPDRSVNSGRITNIGDGTYSDSKDIAAASDQELDEFIAQNEVADPVRGVKVPIVGKLPVVAYGPIDVETLSPMFHQDLNGIWRFKFGETDQHECKESFGFKHGDQWLRAIAALANNRGGYIFLGVKDKDTAPLDGLDKSYAIVGLKDTAFRDADPADFAKKIKNALDPTPRYQTAIIQIDGKSIGVIYVEQHPSRPVIAACSINDKFKEGDIYFRYTGQSVRIKYSDLRAILDERDVQARKDVLPMVERLLALGPTRALVADLDSGTLGDGKQQIVIDQILVDQIKFIREGDFMQQVGAPTLKLVGTVTAIGNQVDEVPKIVRDTIGESDIIRDFLQQQKVHFPESYVRQGIDLQRKWLPIFYYVKQTGASPDDLAAKISKEKTVHKGRRDELVSRLRKKGCAKPNKISSNALRKMAKSIEEGSIPAFKTGKEAATFADAVTCVDKTSIALDEMLRVLGQAQDLIEAEEPKSVGRVCKAICRIDELFFG